MNLDHQTLISAYLSRLGRLGGHARAKSLNKAQRSRAARKAARARWRKSKARKG